MSKIVRCAEGHYYDADKFSTCPHCEIKAGKTVGAVKKDADQENLDDAVTVAKHFFVKKDRIRKKPNVSGEIVKPPKKDFKNEITPEMWEVWERAHNQNQNGNVNGNQILNRTQPTGDDSVTVRFELPESGLEPVVGWLVCVSGKKKGQDYRLKSGFNRIGRDRKMDVVVTGDNTVSRDTHCSVVYDKKSNETYLAPGKGTLTYYKGEMITKSRKLQSGDEIEIGETRYIFISFCEGERSWEGK